MDPIVYYVISGLLLTAAALILTVSQILLSKWYRKIMRGE